MGVMKPRRSAGVLLYRRGDTGPEVFLVHMGGPFWAHKDEGGWTIPKGEYDPDTESAAAAARREFTEETGLPCPSALEFLGTLKQAGGKQTEVWVAEGDADPHAVRSNTVEMEWPKGSGKMHVFPEVDRAGWFDMQTARRKLCKSVAPVVDMLQAWQRWRQITANE